LTRWFHKRVGNLKGRPRRVAIVALARKLMVALWRYLTTGLIPPAPSCARACKRPRAMTADVNQNRRVTAPVQGTTLPVLSDGSRLFSGLPWPGNLVVCGSIGCARCLGKFEVGTEKRLGVIPGTKRCPRPVVGIAVVARWLLEKSRSFLMSSKPLKSLAV
jgi:hypothetical protein